ncbi:MAG: three-Cys-motif partner protein TcmP [Prosthecobacter sp.]
MSDAQRHLFDLSQYPIEEKQLQFSPINGPVWTGNKARLIQRYLRYFTFITKHGTYIDVCAGPQEPDHTHTWAAKLVLEAKPHWLRHFVFFEENDTSFGHLSDMVSAQPKIKGRDIVQKHGDMNRLLPEYLAENPIRDTEATFCLLDQRTFECDWATVKYLATHKKGGNKIEQFYFLAQKWLDRSVAAITIDKKARMERWWGTGGWETLIKKPSVERGAFLAERFKNELGYKYAYAFPIFEKPAEQGNGATMFYMIHASDHEEAPKLMFRAYRTVVAPLEPIEQLEMELGHLEQTADDAKAV